MLYRLATARSLVSHPGAKRVAVQVRFKNGHSKPRQPVQPPKPPTWNDYWRMVIGTYWDDKAPKSAHSSSYSSGEQWSKFFAENTENLIGMVAVSSVLGLVRFCQSFVIRRIVLFEAHTFTRITFRLFTSAC